MYALRVPAEQRSLAVVSAFVWALASDAGLNQHQAYRLRLAVDEIVTNILTHGYRHCDEPSRCPPIDLWAEIDSRTVSITIEDGGVPYDITQDTSLPNLDLPPQERDPGGLGIFLVVRYIDDIRYDYVNGRNINRLTMIRD